MKKNSKGKIPNFKTKEEEAAFWETHSLADYWSEFKDVDLSVEMARPKDETIVLRLQKTIKDKLEQAAKSRGINVSALARMWLMEKLQQSQHI